MKFFCAVIFLLVAAVAFAGEQPFDRAAFDRLQKEGEPILVYIHAEWCPTCWAQAPVVAGLLAQEPYRRIHAFRVDFDRQKDVMKSFKTIHQSTLIVFKDGDEVDRSLGDTSAEGIEALLQEAL